jgi:hypothetical protein
MFDVLWSAILRKLSIDPSLDLHSVTTQLAYNALVQTIAAGLLLLVVLLIVSRRRKKAVKPKVTALKLIALDKARLSPSAAMDVLRQAVRCYYPRAYVDSLSGESWFRFLDSQTTQPLFHDHLNEWELALQPTARSFTGNADDKARLIAQCEQWLEQSLPPTRKQRNAVPKRAS